MLSTDEMKSFIYRQIFLIIFLLSGVHVFLAQNKYVYEKGVSYKNIEAQKIDDAIDLCSAVSSVVYEKSVPVDRHTLYYDVKLPEYACGIFFSRDYRPGDYHWPNNTNRLLPWKFSRLNEITRPDYAGIPSNSAPSVLGDVVLLWLTDNTYLFLKSLCGDNSLSWFQVNADGTLSLYVSTLGDDYLQRKIPLLLSSRTGDIYKTLNEAYDTLIRDKKISKLRKRTDKHYFEAFNYLGWCTWEHYHTDINETRILNDIDIIENSGIPVRYVLIDDGHVANKRRQLTGFIPDSICFPHQWERIIGRKTENGIRWMGLWFALSGYWLGISEKNDLPDRINDCLYQYNGSLLPGKSVRNIKNFYKSYVKTLKDFGFDFLKIDNQSFTLPLYMGGREVILRSKECNLALEKETYRQKIGLMNCMAQNTINTDHTLYSGVTRVSIDYKKYDKDMAKSHLYQSYANTLLFGQTVWPDHDMFHSCDTICGSLMARSKAMSGAPVYLSDAPDEFKSENIFPLIDEEGRIFRPLAPAVPTPESVFINPLIDGKAYRVFAPVGTESMSIICYNLNTRPEYEKVTASISKEDYDLLKTVTHNNFPDVDSILLYDWNFRKAIVLTDNYSVELTGFSDRLFHLCPIRKGWGIIGIQEKYLSPATIRIVSASPERIILDVLCAGTLVIWAEADGKHELRNIPINPGRISIEK